jgi:hypothetical protein
MPAAGRGEYRLATGPVMGFIHPDSDNYPDGRGEPAQASSHPASSAPTDNPASCPADTGRLCPPGQVRDVTGHGEELEQTMAVQQPGRGLRQPRARIRARPRSADGSGLDRRTPRHAQPLRIGQKAQGLNAYERTSHMVDM